MPADLAHRAEAAATSPKPLPAQFRLTPDQHPVAVASPATGDGIGAGGGEGVGRPTWARPAPGAVLVVTHLDPRLATVIPASAGWWPRPAARSATWPLAR